MALQEGRQGLEQALAGLGLSPHLAGLRPYARWITPMARSQRYDTMFYLACMPAGQEALCDQRETSEGLWLGPARALRENQEGRVELAPPQVRILGELATYPSLAALWQRQADLTPLLPFLWASQGSRHHPAAPRPRLRRPGPGRPPRARPALPGPPGQPPGAPTGALAAL